MAHSLVILLHLVICTAISAADNTCKSAAHPLVSGMYGVKDWALRASSSYDSRHGPHRARLNTVRDAKNPVGAWCSKATDKNRPWIEVRFEDAKIVKMIQTQGRSDHTHYIKNFTISTSVNCKKFYFYKEYGRRKIFWGNRDRNTVVTRILKYPRVALCVRIHVVNYQSWPCMRFDVLGGNACPPGYAFFQRSCYKLTEEKFSWSDAAAYCRWEGGKLATIRSRRQNYWLTSYLRRQASRYTTQKQKRCSKVVLKSGKILKPPLEKICYRVCVSLSNCTAFVTSTTDNGCLSMHCFQDRFNVGYSQKQDLHFIVARTEDIWISTNRISNQNQWVTSPNIPAKFTNWAYREPNGQYLHNCATMSPRRAHKWTSKPCTSRFHFVCQTPQCKVR